jgi:hypothetical protein
MMTNSVIEWRPYAFRGFSHLQNTARERISAPKVRLGISGRLDDAGAR